MKTVAAILGGLLVVLGLVWIFQGNDFLLYKVFAPRQEAVRRQVFETSRAFNQGMVQELQNMQFEWVKQKEPEAKSALADIILHRAAGYNMEDPVVPPDLRAFVASLKREMEEAR